MDCAAPTGWLKPPMPNRVSRMRLGESGMKVPFGSCVSGCQSGNSSFPWVVVIACRLDPSAFMTARLESLVDAGAVWKTICSPSGDHLGQSVALLGYSTVAFEPSMSEAVMPSKLL